jgi:hypothetical protein
MVEITKRKIPCGLSFSPDFIREIDSKRGDISRSRFVLRLIEKSMNETESLRELSVN